jgi:small multidrug resistance family-3 protein
MPVVRTLVLFIVTAVAVIVGCYLAYLWLRRSAPVWVLPPAALSLAAFAWLLSLHSTAAGRVYAAYGRVYVSAALGWHWIVEGVRPTRRDVIGVLVTLLGMSIIMLGPRSS